jgi:hypothetical protein
VPAELERGQELRRLRVHARNFADNSNHRIWIPIRRDDLSILVRHLRIERIMHLRADSADQELRGRQTTLQGQPLQITQAARRRVHQQRTLFRADRLPCIAEFLIR